METNNKLDTKKLIFIAGVAVFIAIIGIAAFLFSGIGANSNSEEEVIVNIETGSGYYQILDKLDEAGLIKNKTAAKIYVKLFAPDNPQANAYVLRQNMDLKTMLNIIGTGDFNYLLKTQFTLIEGSTIPEAATSIAEALGFEVSDVMQVWSDETYLNSLIDEYWFLTEEILNNDIMFPLEGYLYPETYFVVDQEPTVESVTKYCLDLTSKKLEPYKDQIASLNMTVHEFLSLASVVEDESLFKEDYAAIAGVFFNRLEADMPLQSDSTVLYALQEKHIDVSLKDLEVNSKYNTYMYAGIPVGPICNVQEAIIAACANYEAHDYYYFFATEDGKVLYGKTLAEHNQNVQENLWY